MEDRDVLRVVAFCVRFVRTHFRNYAEITACIKFNSAVFLAASAIGAASIPTRSETFSVRGKTNVRPCPSRVDTGRMSIILLFFAIEKASRHDAARL